MLMSKIFNDQWRNYQEQRDLISSFYELQGSLLVMQINQLNDIVNLDF